jgi:hypothetical protein
MYEYRVFKADALSHAELEDELNELANRGWRVVAVPNTSTVVCERDRMAPKERSAAAQRFVRKVHDRLGKLGE